MKKKIFLTTLIFVLITGCSKQELSNEESDILQNILFSLDKDSISISPDGGSIDVIVYSNQEWKIIGESDWCTPSIKSGKANENGQKVSFSAELTYDERETIFWFCYANKKIALVVSQNLKETIISDENNTFDIPAEGGIATINYQTTVDCNIHIPDEAKSWISISSSNSRSLVTETINLDIAENTTYNKRSAVVKIVISNNKNVAIEYTINQKQNDVIIVDENDISIDGWNTSFTINYKTNIDCEVVINDDAKQWLSFSSTLSRTLTSKTLKFSASANNTGVERSAVVKIVAVDKSEIFAEYKITQNPRYLIEYTSTNSKVVTPYSVNALGSNIISNNYENGKGIIELKEPILSIGKTCFWDCWNLKSITIPQGVTSIEELAFAGCYDLENITIPNGVNTIGRQAFCNCSNLTHITLPGSVSSIGDEAFESCTRLSSVDLGSGVSVLGDLAFTNCSSLENIILPNGLTTIGSSAFTGCLLLTNITIPDNVTSIGSSPFAGCRKIKEFKGKYSSLDGRCLIVENNLLAFAPYGITDYTIPNGVKSIKQAVFRDCSKLTRVVIPNGVTSIGKSAFTDCVNLSEINIPGSITSIDAYAFKNCSALVSIDIPQNVTTIASCVFENCKLLTSIIIPNKVTEIESSAFKNCWNLSDVVLSNGLTTISHEAFYNCDLKSVTLPESVKFIGQKAFSYNYSLKSVYCKPKTPPTGNPNMFYSNNSALKFYVPNESVEKYEDADYWRDYYAFIVGYDF